MQMTSLHLLTVVIGGHLSILTLDLGNIEATLVPNIFPMLIFLLLVVVGAAGGITAHELFGNCYRSFHKA
jgi:hypothetical protein